MDTYVVRIYRRSGAAAGPAGTIEHVESGERVGFASARELLERLLARRGGPTLAAASPPLPPLSEG